MAEKSAPNKEKWFQVEPDEPEAVVEAIVARAAAIENATMGSRYQNALYARMATGRDLPVLFGSSLTRRVGPASAAAARARFTLPTDNIIALGIETIFNLFGCNRSWITVIPDGDFNARTQAKAQEAWFAKTFERHRLYQDIAAPCFIDAETWGDGLTLVDVNERKTDVRYVRILRDECLVDEIEAARGNPTSIIIARLVNREDLLDDYVGASAEVVEAIENAQPASIGVSTQMGDVVLVYEAWKLPDPDGKHGRHTKCLADFMLKDEAWTRKRFPLARMRGIPQSLGFWSMGIPEAGWDYQLEVNRTMAVIHEGQKHGAIGTILAREDSNISTKQLQSSLQQRIVRYDTEKPDFVAPPAVSPEIYAYRREIKDEFLMRIGVSSQQAGGVKDPGITSGRALITMEQIHDRRNINWAKNAEDYLTDVADLTYEAAEAIKLKVDTPEGPIEWDQIAMRPGGARRRAFPISALPSEPAGRQQRIATWYANGFISRSEAFRLEDVPDTERFVSLATAVQDELEWTLDKIITEQKYYPPEVYDDPATAIQTVNARYHYEKRRAAPPRVLKLLRDFMAQLAELAANPAALPPAPPAPQAVAPSPVQTAPDMGAPVAPAPAQPMQAAA